jgi:hypothetical protein
MLMKAWSAMCLEIASSVILPSAAAPLPSLRPIGVVRRGIVVRYHLAAERAAAPEQH